LQGTIRPPTSRGPNRLTSRPDSPLPASSSRWSGRMGLSGYLASGPLSLVPVIACVPHRLNILFKSRAYSTSLFARSEIYTAILMILSDDGNASTHHSVHYSCQVAQD